MSATSSTASTDTHASSDRTRLRGSLGIAAIVFMVIAASSPLTVVAGAVPVALAIGNGPGLPSAYLIVAVILIVFSVGYTTMSRHVTNAGAYYSYVTQGLGRAAGLGTAFVALVSYTAIQLSVYGLFGATLSDLLVSWHAPRISWWVCALIAWAVVAVFGYRNVDLSVKVLGVLLVIESLVILVMDFAVLGQGGAHGISGTSFTPHAFFTGSAGVGIVFAIASYGGIEATAIYGEEAKRPERTIPLSTYIGVALIGLFYTFSSWSIVTAYGPGAIMKAAQDNISGLTFATADQYAGGGIKETMNVLLVTSLFAVLLAFHNAIARYLFSLGRESVLPARFGLVHEGHKSPHVGSVAQTVSALVLVVICAAAKLDPVAQVFSWMSGLTTLGLIVLMGLTSLAVLAFFRRTRADTRVWNTRLAPVLGFAGLMFLLVLVVMNYETLIGGSTALAVGFELVVAVAFVLGVALAMAWRRARPDAYAKIGSFRG